MKLKNNFIQSVEKLKSRNQKFVNKNGVSDYTIQSDNIIYSLVEYFNHCEQNFDIDLKQISQKLEIICMITGINIDQFIQYDSDELLYELRFQQLDQNQYTNLMSLLFQVQHNIKMRRWVLRSYLIDIETFYMFHEVDEIREYLFKQRPELVEYFDINIPLNDTLELFKSNFYAGNFNP